MDVYKTWGLEIVLGCLSMLYPSSNSFLKCGVIKNKGWIKPHLFFLALSWRMRTCSKSTLTVCLDLLLENKRFLHCIYTSQPLYRLSLDLLVPSRFSFRVLIPVSTFAPSQVKALQRLEEDFKPKRNFSRIFTSIKPLLSPLHKTIWTIQIKHYINMIQLS